MSHAAASTASPDRDPPAGSARGTRALARSLAGWCVQQLEEIEQRYAPGFVLPGTFAGHAVGADVRADLLYTLAQLAEAGVTAVGGRSPDAIAAQLIAGVSGAATHSFYSYRIAETLLRHGTFAGNPLLAECDEIARAQVALACDSTAWFGARGLERLPRNYAAVLARCELGRVRLGLIEDDAVVDGLVDRLRLLLEENPECHLDDSGDRSGRYDIYTADVWVFCVPLADRLGPCWRAGVEAALELTTAVGGPDGAAIPWGRSTGVLAAALTIELAALALTTGTRSDGDAAAWLRRALDARDAVESSFGGGLARAHQHRSQDAYRGPARRLQLTLDVVGKLAWSAARLQGARDDWAAAGHRATYQDRDELRRFARGSAASVWSYRQGPLSFVVPFVGSVRSHYLPAPIAPGCFEVPVDADLPCWTPLVIAAEGRWTGGGLPSTIDHGPGTVSAVWNGLPATGPGVPMSGQRRARFRVEARTLVLDDELDLDQLPGAVSLTIPELPRRPLRVEVTSSSGHRLSTIDVSGIAEWRSSWSELGRVHQIELLPSRRMQVTVRVTPLLQVMCSSHRHPYSRLLYQPMGDRVLCVAGPGERRELRSADLFHLHWPEGLSDDLDTHRRLIGDLADYGVPVVWTAHNLTPHRKRPEVFEPIYQAWADASAAVIHHTHWGERLLRARYHFPGSCRHEVIPHGHFAERFPSLDTPRGLAEGALGLPPAPLRIGLVGAPRREKQVRAFLEGAARVRRDDLQVVCWSLPPGEPAPSSPRIAHAEPYRAVDDWTYGLRLAACDGLALPVDPDGEMLSSGVVADALGAGLAVFGSAWGYLAETLVDALIPCGHTATEVHRQLEGLDPERVAQARRAAARLRPRHDWRDLARRTADLFEAVVLPPSPLHRGRLAPERKP
jgi:glycosyltransferase involved in cell wall biosynthesis